MELLISVADQSCCFLFHFTNLTDMPQNKDWFFDYSRCFAEPEDISMPRAAKLKKTANRDAIFKVDEDQTDFFIGMARLSSALYPSDHDCFNDFDVDSTLLGTEQEKFVEDLEASHGGHEYLRSLHHVVYKILRLHSVYRVPLFEKENGLARELLLLYQGKPGEWDKMMCMFMCFLIISHYYLLFAGATGAKAGGFFNPDFSVVEQQLNDLFDVVREVKHGCNKLEPELEAKELGKIGINDLLPCFVRGSFEKGGPLPVIFQQLSSHVNDIVSKKKKEQIFGWRGDTTGAIIILFVMGFYPRFLEDDRKHYAILMNCLAKHQKESFSNEFTWLKLAEHIMVSGPLLLAAKGAGGQVRIVGVMTDFSNCIFSFLIFPFQSFLGPDQNKIMDRLLNSHVAKTKGMLQTAKTNHTIIQFLAATTLAHIFMVRFVRNKSRLVGASERSSREKPIAEGYLTSLNSYLTEPWIWSWSNRQKGSTCLLLRLFVVKSKWEKPGAVGKKRASDSEKGGSQDSKKPRSGKAKKLLPAADSGSSATYAVGKKRASDSEKEGSQDSKKPRSGKAKKPLPAADSGSSASYDSDNFERPKPRQPTTCIPPVEVDDIGKILPPASSRGVAVAYSGGAQSGAPEISLAEALAALARVQEEKKQAMKDKEQAMKEKEQAQETAEMWQLMWSNENEEKKQLLNRVLQQISAPSPSAGMVSQSVHSSVTDTVVPGGLISSPRVARLPMQGTPAAARTQSPFTEKPAQSDAAVAGEDSEDQVPGLQQPGSRGKVLKNRKETADDDDDEDSEDTTDVSISSLSECTLENLAIGANHDKVKVNEAVN